MPYSFGYLGPCPTIWQSFSKIKWGENSQATFKVAGGFVKVRDFGRIWRPLATAFIQIWPRVYGPSEGYTGSTLGSNFKAIGTKMRPPEGGKVETLAPPSDEVY